MSAANSFNYKFIKNLRHTHVTLAKREQRMKNKTISKLLLSTTLITSLAACTQPPAPVDVAYETPFQHLSKANFREIKAKLRENGVIIYKQERSVQIIMKAQHLFYRNTNHINPNAAATLNQVATLIKHAPTAKIRVIGFSNYLPTLKQRQAQSKRMAEVVAKQIRLRGVPSWQKIHVRGAGNKPISGSLTSAGNVANERVEVRIN